MCCFFKLHSSLNSPSLAPSFSPFLLPSSNPLYSCWSQGLFGVGCNLVVIWYHAFISSNLTQLFGKIPSYPLLFLVMWGRPNLCWLFAVGTWDMVLILLACGLGLLLAVFFFWVCRFDFRCWLFAKCLLLCPDLLLCCMLMTCSLNCFKDTLDWKLSLCTIKPANHKITVSLLHSHNLNHKIT